MVHAVVIAVFAAIVLLAGAGVARRVFRGVIDDESRLLLSAACGGTVVAFALVILWRAHAMTHGGIVLSAVLAACIALNGREGLHELRDAARASWRPWTFFGLAAVAATAAFHGRQIRFDDDGGFSWGGTLGVESMFHAAVSGALLRGETVWPEPTFQVSGRIQYHVFSHLLAGAASRWGGIGVIEIYARSLPVVLFTFAFASHRWLLRTWFPASWTLSAAALLPLLVTDFTPWARFIGLVASDTYENRTGHSFVVSPSFVAGEAFACVATGLAVRLGRLGADAPRSGVVATGVILGSIVGWKLPSAAIAAIAVAALLPWLRARCGTRAMIVAVVAAGITAAVTHCICWGRALGGSDAKLTDPQRWLERATADPVLFGCAVLWPFLVLGARCLRPRSLWAMLREDVTILAVLAAAVSGIVGVLLLRVPPFDEDKYLLRSGTYALLLVVVALIFRDVASPGRRRWWGIASCVVLAMTCAWQVRQVVRGAPTEHGLTGAEVRALRDAGQSGGLRTVRAADESAWSAAAGCAIPLGAYSPDGRWAIVRSRADATEEQLRGGESRILGLVAEPVPPPEPPDSSRAIYYEPAFVGPNIVIYTRAPSAPR